jgi:hypothetical protein
MLNQTTITDDKPFFVNTYNIVHIDEKWFDMKKRKRDYYLMPEEPDPQRTIHNKNNISKVMFLTAVARPRFDEDEDEKVLFDGKLGVWAFVIDTLAKNNSKNRPKGIIELKSLIVTRDVMREYLLEKVIPAIHAQWPDDNEIIFI